MKYLILIGGGALLLVITGLSIWIAALMASQERAANKERQKEAERDKRKSEITEKANNEKERMETGNSAADFDASIELLHQHASRTK